MNDAQVKLDIPFAYSSNGNEIYEITIYDFVNAYNHFPDPEWDDKPITREEQVVKASSQIFNGLADRQKDFQSFVLSKYIETGVSEVDQEKLPSLLELKYQSITDAAETLGGVDAIKNTFIEFQKYLYEIKAA